MKTRQTPVLLVGFWRHPAAPHWRTYHTTIPIIYNEEKIHIEACMQATRCALQEHIIFNDQTADTVSHLDRLREQLPWAYTVPRAIDLIYER